MKAVNDYHDLYLRCNVFLLADVFEKFKSTRLKNYELFPSHYLSAPVLIWDEILNMTKVGIERILDVDMYLPLHI